MVRRKEAQVAALVYVTAAIVLRFVPVPVEAVGIFPGAPFVHRVLYPFFHASWLHCLVNCWCLLSIVFLYEISLPMLIGSFIVAASFPFNGLSFLYASFLPTVGMSGVCYALLGRYSLLVRRKLYYQCWVLCFIGIGFIFPTSNAWLHLYCYAVGVLLSFLNKPLNK